MTALDTYARTDQVDGGPSPVAWRPTLTVAGAVAALLLAFAHAYGYHPDELYFRLLGLHDPTWGYVDQPMLLPLLVRGCIEVFGDSVWAIRVPAVACSAAMVVLATMIAAEFGATRRAQLLTTLGMACSVIVLSFGNIMSTSTVDTTAWCVVLLFLLRALLRGDGRWWLAAGVACGLALYAKYIVLLLPVSVLLGLLLVGPRAPFRDRRLYLGMALALGLGAPNLVYQVIHHFPQVHMAQGLGQTDGTDNREMFAVQLLGLIGPPLVAVWGAGLVGVLRDPAWRPVRALGIGYLLATVGALGIQGGRADYTCGFLIGLYAAGCVRVDRWMARRAARIRLVTAGLVSTLLLNLWVSLPVVPQQALDRITPTQVTRDSVGWPAEVRQVAAVYRGLPKAEKPHTVVVVDNFAEAGALDRYGRTSHLPTVYSGHNELYRFGPPPSSARQVVAVALPARRLHSDFAHCRVVARIDNGLGVHNQEQHQPIAVCHGRRAPWKTLWPHYHQLRAYQ